MKRRRVRTILRTLTGLEVGQRTGRDLLHAVRAHGPRLRRRLASSPATRELPISDQLVLVPKEDILSRTWKVVWFRTLNEEERAVLR